MLHLCYSFPASAKRVYKEHTRNGPYVLPLLSSVSLYSAFSPVILFALSIRYRQGLKVCFRLAVGKCCSCLVFRRWVQGEMLNYQNYSGLLKGVR